VLHASWSRSLARTANRIDLACGEQHVFALENYWGLGPDGIALRGKILIIGVRNGVFADRPVRAAATTRRSLLRIINLQVRPGMVSGIL